MLPSGTPISEDIIVCNSRRSFKFMDFTAPKYSTFNDRNTEVSESSDLQSLQTFLIWLHIAV